MRYVIQFNPVESQRFVFKWETDSQSGTALARTVIYSGGDKCRVVGNHIKVDGDIAYFDRNANLLLEELPASVLLELESQLGQLMGSVRSGLAQINKAILVGME